MNKSILEVFSVEMIVIAVIAAATAGFILYRLAHYKYSGCKKAGYVIIPCSKDTKGLEELVRAYYWEEAFENESLAREILLVIMEHSENDYTAKRLQQEYRPVRAVDISELADYLKKKEIKCCGKK